jgi:hypothetical protein
MPDNVQVHWDWFPYGFAGYVIFNIGLAFMLRKANVPWWGAIIPLYNFYLTVKLAGWRGWSVIWFIIPIANVVAFVLLCAQLPRSFDRGFGYSLGLFFLFPFFMLALGLNNALFLGRMTGTARA